MNFYKILFISFSLLYSFEALAQSQYNQNFDSTRVSSVDDYIKFYQRYFSDLRNGSCPMYPSCSRYAIQSIKERGFFNGLISSSDRLLRCGHEHGFYNITLQDEGFKFIDLPATQIEDKLLRFQIASKSFTENITYKDTVINEIASLINDGYHNEAIIAINKRKIRGDLSNDLIAFEMLCLNSMKRYEDVLLKYKYLNDSSKNYLPIIKQVIKSHNKLGNYTSIIDYRDKIAVYDSADNRASQLKSQIVSSYLRIGNYSGAKNYINEANMKYQDFQEANKAIYNLSTLKMKSVSLAKTLSFIVPGSGYVYAGHTMTGITALLINGLLAYSTVTSFNSGNSGVGILTGILNLGFYFGNIQGAGNSARRYNTNKKEDIIRNFENKSILIQ